MKAFAPESCDLCYKELRRSPHFYDAKTHTGSWAWLCRACFLMYAYGIGVGVGQEYDSETNEKVRG